MSELKVTKSDQKFELSTDDNGHTASSKPKPNVKSELVGDNSDLQHFLLPIIFISYDLRH